VGLRLNLVLLGRLVVRRDLMAYQGGRIRVGAGILRVRLNLLVLWPVAALSRR
jgi:hypothetical protein